MRYFSVSEIKSWWTCHRKHAYKYQDGREPVKKSAALSFGSLFHEGLEAYMKDGFGAAVEAMGRVEADPFEHAKAVALSHGAAMKYGSDAFKVLDVEGRFEREIDAEHGIGVMGYADALIEIDGKPGVMEHKTSSQDITRGSYYWEDKQNDLQIGMEMIALSGTPIAKGLPVRSCLYNVVRKLDMRPSRATPPANRKFKKDGTPYATTRMKDERPSAFMGRCVEYVSAHFDDIFVRELIEYDDETLDEIQSDFTCAAEEIMMKFRDRNLSSCMAFRSLCGYHPVCCRNADIDDNSLFRERGKR